MGWATNDGPTKERCAVAASLAKQQLYITKKKFEELEATIKEIKHTEKREAMLNDLSRVYSHLDALYTCLDSVQFHLSR